MFTATLPGGSGWRVWTISYNMQQLVLSCVCVTLVLHCIGVVAAGRLRAGGPTPLQLGLYYYSSGFVLIIYAAGVALIVRARPAEPADDLPLQQSRASTSDRCNALLNGVILVAACGGPPAFLVFLMRPVPALVVLVCLAVAGGLSAAVWWCWLCLAAGPAADREPRQQFVSLVEGVNLRSQDMEAADGRLLQPFLSEAPRSQSHEDALRKLVDRSTSTLEQASLAEPASVSAHA